MAEKSMSVEIASAYVSLSADTRQIPKDVKKALGQAEGAASSSGQSIGQKISSGLSKTLKAGALTGGAAAGAALGMSLKKGFDRLSAIEQSEAKLSGLGHSTESVAKIMDNALGSVKGTAYGLGDAASVAAGMVASGIKPGKELEGVLKTMGDTAAISGRDLTDMGLIFQSVAAKGKLQGDDMMQLMSSGIPVLQLLGDELGKTSEEVSEMVSNGEIDFETFEKAMKKGMGGAALEAGKTFKGSMDNMGAAMGRFGETLLKGAFSKAPEVIGSVTDGIDALNDKVGGAIELFSTGEFSEDIGEKLGVGKDSAVVDRILSAREAVDKMRGAVELFFTGDFTGGIREKLGLEEDDPLVGQILEIRDVFADWGERVGDVFGQIGRMAESLAPSFGSIALSLGKAVGAISAATWEALLRVLEALVPVLERVLVPALEKLAEVMEENPGLVKAVVGAFVGFKVLKSISGPVRAFTGTVRALSAGFGTLKAVLAVGGKGSILTGLKGFGAAAGKAAPKGGLLSRALGGISRAGGAVARFLPTLGKAFTFLITKINPVVAVISVVVGALTWFFTKTETGKKVFEGLKDTLETVWNWIRDTFVAGFERAGEILGGVWDSVSEGWESVWEGITEFFSQVWENLKLAWEATGQPVVDLVKGAWDVLSDGLQIGWNIIKASFEALWIALQMAWETFGQPIVDWVVNAFNGMKDRLGEAWDWVKGVWSGLMSWFGEKWQQYGQPIIDWVVNAFNYMRDRLSEAWDRVKEIWNSLWNTVRSYWDSYGQPVVDTVVNAFNWFRDKIGEAFDKVKEFAQGLIDTIREKFDEVVETVSGVKDRILDAVSDAKDWLVDAGKWLIEGLWNGIKSMGSWITNKLTSWIPDKIKKPFENVLEFGSPSKLFKQYGKWLIEGLAIGVDSMGNKIEKSMVGIADRVAGVDMPTVQVSAQINDQGLNVEATASNVAVANPAPTSRYEGGEPPAVRAVEQGTESFEASSEAVNASVNATFDPAVQQADLSMTGFGANVQATATGVVTPQWQGMAQNVANAAKGVIDPAFTSVRDGLSATGSWFQQQTTGVMSPMWNAMGANVQRVQSSVTDPAMAGIRSALSATGSHFTSSVNGVINPIWSAMGTHVKAVKDGTVIPVFNAVESGLTTLTGWFGTSVNNIGTAWDRLRAATARPARFVIDTVMNDGIRNAWNAVADLIDEKPMGRVGHNLGGYARGGVLPGYTPGRDVHHFSSPTGGRVSLSGGEAIMRPEWTRAIGGPKAVAEMNSAARSGKFSKRAKEESKANGYRQAFAEGGIVNAMTRIVQRKYPMLTMTSGRVGRTGGLHGAGMAADFSNGSGNTPQQLALARDISKTYPNSAELIYDSPGWSGNIKNGQNVGPFGQFYTMGQAGPHHHHVHWGMNTAPTMPFGGGVFPGGSSGGAAAMVSMAEMAKDAWDAEIKKIPKYNGKNGLIDSMPGSYQKSASEKAWGYLKKQADKMDADAGPGSWNPGAGVEQYRAGIKKAFRFQQEDPKKNRVDALLRQIWTESKGDPNIAQQIVDMNGTGESAGVGLYQVIPGTWAGYRDPRLPDNRRNVWAAHNFAVRYFRDRHNWNTGPGGVGLPNTGWKSGGVLPENLPAALFDNGGYLQDGQVGVNKSGKPEPVFTNAQWNILKGNIATPAQNRGTAKFAKDIQTFVNNNPDIQKVIDIGNDAQKAFFEKHPDPAAVAIKGVGDDVLAFFGANDAWFTDVEKLEISWQVPDPDSSEEGATKDHNLTNAEAGKAVNSAVGNVLAAGGQAISGGQVTAGSGKSMNVTVENITAADPNEATKLLRREARRLLAAF